MGTSIRKTAEKSSEKLFKLMKFCTVPNFHSTDLSLYHIIVLLGHGAFVLRARTPDLRAVLRFHGGIQRAEIVQTAPAQCLRIGLQRFLVHKQHILARVEVGVLTI